MLTPRGTTGAVDVRGGAPGSRETDLLDPANSVRYVDAVVLTGGSAFGLAAADGVMTWLEEHGRGIAGGTRAIACSSSGLDRRERGSSPAKLVQRRLGRHGVGRRGCRIS